MVERDRDRRYGDWDRSVSHFCPTSFSMDRKSSDIVWTFLSSLQTIFLLLIIVCTHLILIDCRRFLSFMMLFQYVRETFTTTENQHAKIELYINKL